MSDVFKNSWALLLGMLLLLTGNGIQGTLLGIRGAQEGYDAMTMSWVMSAYFAGFLFGSWQAPVLIRQVGHVRVFAALASLVSAAFILYAAVPDPVAWLFMRFLVGFCFSGIYVVAESWLNESSTNQTRGKALSVYTIMQMAGLIAAQGVLNLADPSDYTLFVVMSVLVSVSFLPILLSVSPVPAYATATPMTLKELFGRSPLGVVGMFLLGGVFSGLFSMSSVYAAQKGLSVAQISVFVAAVYSGGLLFQLPIGAISDRSDRRKLIVLVTLAGAAACLYGTLVDETYVLLLGVAFVVGGISCPLYSLLIAYTNDHLEATDMASASGSLVFINGLGAISGPVIIGGLMNRFGPDAFFGFLGLLLTMIAGYALYRMSRRPALSGENAVPYSTILPQASPLAVEVTQELTAEASEEAAEDVQALDYEAEGGLSITPSHA